jgi:hypothetical protein
MFRAELAAFLFQLGPPSDSKSRPAATNAHTKEAGGRGSLGPANILPTSVSTARAGMEALAGNCFFVKKDDSWGVKKNHVKNFLQRS